MTTAEYNTRVRRLWRIVVWIQAVQGLVILGLLAGLLTVIGAAQQAADNAVSGSCGFYALIGELPVIPSGKTMTSKVGLQIVIDARNAYLAQRCTTPLLPPSTALRELAARYHVRISG